MVAGYLARSGHHTGHLAAGGLTAVLHGREKSHGRERNPGSRCWASRDQCCRPGCWGRKGHRRKLGQVAPTMWEEKFPEQQF